MKHKSHSRFSYTGITKWTGGVIPFTIDPNFGVNDVTIIDALREIEQKQTIVFHLKNEQLNKTMLQLQTVAEDVTQR
jgi:hypothetical protein